jgi:hypothetical protein
MCGDTHDYLTVAFPARLASGNRKTLSSPLPYVTANGSTAALRAPTAALVARIAPEQRIPPTLGLERGQALAAVIGRLH